MGLDALVGWLVLEEEVLRVSVHPTVYGLRCLSRSRYCLRAARAGCFGGLSALSSGKQI